jgi:two-component system C4-dicarboxylate transport sensor histidine kinase DctB
VDFVKQRLSIIFGLYVIFSLGVIAWVYFDALDTALSSDREAGQVRLSEATSRLRGQLDVYRALVNIISKDPKMAAALHSSAIADVNSDLSQLSLTYGAWELDLTDSSGRVIASSATNRTGHIYSRSLTRAALNGRLGYAVELEEGQRLIRFSRGIIGSNSAAKGVVVISANLATLEFEWPVAPEPVVFFNTEGLSMSSNRPSLLLLSNADDPEEFNFPVKASRHVAGATLWSFAPSNGVVSEVQTLNSDIPQLQMTGQILLDTRTARATALLRAGLAAALLVALALICAIFVEQRRRLAFESRQSATLEHRVEERTAELRAAQNELVEASNLAALGRLSAGISHELNQPLAAILNFAENGKRFIGRSRTSEAVENFSLIGDQIRRITRIIGNLRAFSRQEHTPSDRIDVVGVTFRALELMKVDTDSAGVTVHAQLPDQPIFVMAGKVRLEQVVLNLVSNALDAMQTAKKKVLTVAMEDRSDQIVLFVQDTGAGIKEPERVFEPFYTTKELGSSKGLGMGLALSFGLVSRFGGQLTCRNLKNGAEFTMTLPIAKEAE